MLLVMWAVAPVGWVTAVDLRAPRTVAGHNPPVCSAGSVHWKLRCVRRPRACSLPRRTIRERIDQPTLRITTGSQALRPSTRSAGLSLGGLPLQSHGKRHRRTQASTRRRHVTVPDAESRRASRRLVGRRRRRLPGRARRVPRRRRLRLVPGGPARGRRPAARRRRRPAGAGGRLRRRAVRPLAAPPRAPGRSPATCPPACCGTPRAAADRTGVRVPLVQADALALPFADGVVRHRVHRVRRGAVRGRLGGGDARGVPGAAPRRPLGVLGHPPDALDLPRRPGRGRPGGRALVLRPLARTSSRTSDGVPTYVEQHRTLGDRVRELSRPASSSRPGGAGVAGGARRDLGPVEPAARPALPRHGHLRRHEAGLTTAAAAAAARAAAADAQVRSLECTAGSMGARRVSGRRRSSRGRRRPRPPAARRAGRRRPSRSRTSASSGLALAGGDLEDQLVVDLQQHARAQAGRRAARASTRSMATLMMSAARALDRRVERHPLGHLAALPVVAGEVGQVAAAAQHGLGVAVLAGLRDDLAQVVADPAERGEVLLHQHRAPRPAVMPSCWDRPNARQAVRQAVVHRLDLAALVGADLVERRSRRPTTRWRRGSRRRS